MVKEVVLVIVALTVCIQVLPVKAIAQDPPPPKAKELPEAEMDRLLSRQEALQDVAQFRELLKQEWLLANLNDANFDAGLDEIEHNLGDGLTVAELTVQLERVICLGSDGHAGLPELLRAFDTVKGVKPQFMLEPFGDRYLVYRPEHVDPAARLQPHLNYRFVLLKDGYPFLESIDGVPIETWVKAVDPYVPRAPERVRHWRCMDLLTLHFPFFRRELKLPAAEKILIRLLSEDGADKIDIDAPTSSSGYAHFQVPKPEWQIMAGNIGYLGLPHPDGKATKMIIDTMPKMRSTEGLILDLRGNRGGAGMENLRIVASYLVPPKQPHIVAGLFVRWKDSQNTGLLDSTFLDLDGLDEQSRAASQGLTEQGKEALRQFAARWQSVWKPPSHRATATSYLLLTRAEAEPAIYPFNQPVFPKDTYYYDKPVVVLLDHRCFSAGEIFLAGIRSLPNVTLMGTATTACGGGPTTAFRLANSGLEVQLAGKVFVSASGQLLDGIGIRPDIVVEPEVGYYLGTSDQMLDQAMGFLKVKASQK